jgi:hypothetical protein
MVVAGQPETQAFGDVACAHAEPEVPKEFAAVTL